MLVSVVAVVLFCSLAIADSKSDHAALADSANKLSASAGALAKSAKASDDRAARKKFAPAAQDLGDDLSSFARRAAKDQSFAALASDATGLVKDARALVDLADDVEDKDERKSLRASATLLQQGVEALGKQLVTAASNEGRDGGNKPADGTPRRFTGVLVNNTDKCNWDENVMFQVVKNGQVVYKTQLVFPGKTSALALEQGSYVIQVLETNGDLLVQRPFEAKAEAWQFASGCVKD
jgi:hypothetical protein